MYGQPSRFGDRQRAIAALCELLKQAPNNEAVTWTALHALTSSRARESVPALRELSKTDDEYLRHKIERAIEEISRSPE
jgi:hypothetical protein